MSEVKNDKVFNFLYASNKSQYLTNLTIDYKSEKESNQYCTGQPRNLSMSLRESY